MLWVLVFVLNGQIQKTEPMGAEACILTMLARPAAQAPYCVNPEGKRMVRPPDCEQQRGRPNWCRLD